MKNHINRLVTTAQLVVVCGMGLILMSCGDGGDGPIPSANAQSTGRDFVAPVVFQAAGPDLASIQNTVDQHRAALGLTNNGNNPGPLADGRREINWDGGGSTTTVTGTPLINFHIHSRRSLHHHRDRICTSTSRRPPATTFNNPTYETISSRSVPSGSSVRSIATSPRRCSSCLAPGPRPNRQRPVGSE